MTEEQKEYEAMQLVNLMDRCCNYLSIKFIMCDSVAHPHIIICRAVIQNGSRETGFPRAFLNGQFRLRKAKIGKKTNNFPLCCQLRLRTATEWLSHVSCAVLTLGSACRINLRDCSAGG